MSRNIYFLVVAVLFCFENRVLFIQANQITPVQVRYISVIQNNETDVENTNAIPEDLINLQKTFKTIQKSLHGLQVTLESIKVKQTELHRSLLNMTRSKDLPYYEVQKILRDEKLLLNDIKDVQKDIIKMRRLIGYWETALENLELEQVMSHEKFSKRVVEVINEVEAAFLDILNKIKEGQQILKQDIIKMKFHVNALKTEVKALLENVKKSEKIPAKREIIETPETIAEKGQNVIELGKKLQQLKSNVGHVQSDVRVTLYLSKMKHNLGNIAQNLSKMVDKLGDLNFEQVKIEFDSKIEYPGRGVLPVKVDKLYKEVDSSVAIAVAIQNKLAAVYEAHKNRAELLEEIGNKLLFLSKTVLELEAKLEVVANAILENGQLLVRQGKFNDAVKTRFHIQGGILTKLAGNLENIGDNFEELGKTLAALGRVLTESENSEKRFGKVGALLVEYAIK